MRSQLTPQQLRTQVARQVLAHDYTKGQLLLLSGPGTGKTYSLVRTIIPQLERGRYPGDFYAATFTNAAARDLEEQVQKHSGQSFEGVSTLHYRAKGIVHKYANLVGLRPSFGILSEEERRLVFQEIREDLSIQGNRLTITQVKNFWKAYCCARARLEQPGTDFADQYAECQRFYNALDWYEIPALACQILAENPEVREREAGLQSFVLVDEYQDLNAAEQRFIDLLLGGRTAFLAVGDDDQSIYSRRFADPSGIVGFCDTYPTATKLVLPVSSRCPSAVLEAAHAFIQANTHRQPKPRLIALPETDHRASGGLVCSVGMKSAKAEAQFIAVALRVLLGSGVPVEDIMVLCANTGLGRQLMEDVYKLAGKMPLQDCFSAARQDGAVPQCLWGFLQDHNDNLALRMLLSLVLRLPPAKIRVLRRLAVTGSASLWEVLATPEGLAAARRSKGRLQAFLDYVQEAEELDAAEAMGFFLAKYPTFEQEVKAWLSTLEAETPTPEEFRVEPPRAITGVRFMTLHASKGLQAGYVFIPFMEESVRLPAQDIEEQRRLLYVAITRAKTAVLFSWAWSRRGGARYRAGGGKFLKRKRSPFLVQCGLRVDADPRAAAKQLLELAQHEKDVMSQA